MTTQDGATASKAISRSFEEFLLENHQQSQHSATTSIKDEESETTGSISQDKSYSMKANESSSDEESYQNQD